MRILGIDFGDKNTGIAVSDPFFWTANGLTVLRRKNPVDVSETLQQLGEIIKEYEVGKIVLGYPKNMNNTVGFRGEATLRFQAQLQKRFDIPIELWDERLSTMGANRVFQEANINTKKSNAVIDKMAAVFILQGYLDHMNRAKQNQTQAPSLDNE